MADSIRFSRVANQLKELDRVTVGDLASSVFSRSIMRDAENLPRLRPPTAYGAASLYAVREGERVFAISSARRSAKENRGNRRTLPAQFYIF